MTIQSVYKQIRHRLDEWRKDLKDEEADLKQVKEEAHYSIQVTPQIRISRIFYSFYKVPQFKMQEKY